MSAFPFPPSRRFPPFPPRGNALDRLLRSPSRPLRVFPCVARLRGVLTHTHTEEGSLRKEVRRTGETTNSRSEWGAKAKERLGGTRREDG